MVPTRRVRDREPILSQRLRLIVTAKPVEGPPTLGVMEIRRCVADSDFDAWRVTRLAAIPGDLCPTVAQLRARESPQRLLVAALEDDTALGAGIAAPSDSGDAGFVLAWTAPEHRGQGVGARVLAALTDHGAGQGWPRLASRVEDEASLRFAERRGFVEVDREVEQVRVVGAEPAPAPLADPVEVVRLAEHPALWDQCYDAFGTEVLADFALHTPLQIDRDEWGTTWRGEHVFLAMAGGQVIGCAGATVDSEDPTRAENALTAVARSWRGRGIAAHLKRQTLRWAADEGIRELFTWTQAGNKSMIRLNDHLGYTRGRVSITLSKPMGST